jgi:hypothetical protein
LIDLTCEIVEYLSGAALIDSDEHDADVEHVSLAVVQVRSRTLATLPSSPWISSTMLSTRPDLVVGNRPRCLNDHVVNEAAESHSIEHIDCHKIDRTAPRLMHPS